MQADDKDGVMLMRGLANQTRAPSLCTAVPAIALPPQQSVTMRELLDAREAELRAQLARIVHQRAYLARHGLEALPMDELRELLW